MSIDCPNQNLLIHLLPFVNDKELLIHEKGAQIWIYTLHILNKLKV